MKRTVYLIVTVLLLAAGCGKKGGTPEVQTSLTINPQTVEFTAAALTSQSASVQSNTSWTISGGASWLSVTPTQGSGNGLLTFRAEPNTGKSSRETTLTVTAGSLSKQLKVVQAGDDSEPIVPKTLVWDGQKRGSMTYQLLIYSFRDSDGDGVGDFKGIQEKLDYLENLGATALWLSPAHPADSYHGYDVRDYYALNPAYAVGQHTAEKAAQDFKDLIDAAHAKGIKIYMDYVLNHSGKGHEWFHQALSDPDSPYRDYYFISTNPSADYRTFPMLSGTNYNAGEWIVGASTGSPKLTITKTDEAETTGNSNWNLWYWSGSAEGQALRFVDKGDGTLYLVKEINGTCGLLVRKNMNWDEGSKFGAKAGEGTLTEGKTLELTANGGDISFTGSGRYRIELKDASAQTLYFMGAFGSWMPDLNYGAISDVENNACFQDIAASADQWINMGVDGFRLDAVKHICGGIASYNDAANQAFLAKWYDRCNATYQSLHPGENIFMVGEVWSGHEDEKNYYKGLTSCFEFGYWPLLYRTLTEQNASNYVTTVTRFLNEHKGVRSDAQTSLFLTNHDHSSQTGDGEVRAADDLGKNLAKEKQAAAILLTTGGKPFVYQGEELGYWGNSKNRGDEYLRAPILWDAAGKELAKNGVNGKVDDAMLKGSISVETQSADKNSLLSIYKTFGQLRNTYPALADGTMTAGPSTGDQAVAAWYMTANTGTQKLLVLHNVGSGSRTVTLSDDLSKPIALLGTASKSGGKLTLGANSSVIFEL